MQEVLTMREILFRGKRIDNGEWVEGSLLLLKKPILYAAITYQHEWRDGKLTLVRVDVDPSTVGQYTGKRDKNGKRIFEGDVVYDGFSKDKVVFEDCQWKLVDRHGMWIDLFSREVEVIGDLHGNPELLEGGSGNAIT